MEHQEVYGVRPDVRIMNTSYLGGEWYIDEMKTKANDAPGVPFSLPKRKYTFTNDWVPVDNRFDRAVDIKEVIDFIRSTTRAASSSSPTVRRPTTSPPSASRCR